MTERQMTNIPSPGVSRTEACALAAVRRVAAMLGLDPDAWQEGDPLPRGWQFILLGADTPRSALRGVSAPSRMNCQPRGSGSPSCQASGSRPSMAATRRTAARAQASVRLTPGDGMLVICLSVMSGL